MWRGLQTPILDNLRAKSAKVSGEYLEYPRFWETRAGDRARSALRGVGRSLIQPQGDEARPARSAGVGDSTEFHLSAAPL